MILAHGGATPLGRPLKEVDHLMKHQAATTVAPKHLPTELEALSPLAVTVLNEHTNDADLCAVCGSAWPCEQAVLAEHNVAAL